MRSDLWLGKGPLKGAGDSRAHASCPGQRATSVAAAAAAHRMDWARVMRLVSSARARGAGQHFVRARCVCVRCVLFKLDSSTVERRILCFVFAEFRRAFAKVAHSRVSFRF
jgi:hypothetical protein